MTDSAMIVSNSDKSVSVLTKMLGEIPVEHIVIAAMCGQARRLLIERVFDLVIINAPLSDETGEKLSRQIAASGASQAILIVKNEYFDAVSAVCENDGVLVIPKPVNRAVLWSALKLAVSAQNKFRRIQDENSGLKRKIEDIRIVDRAKCLLIAHLGMSEPEAHRHIEKTAMDLRLPKRAIAEGILNTYNE